MTTAAEAPPRIAIGQLRMHWSVAENLAAILQAITLAASRGAAICSFPELALTGFHRQIASQARPELLQPALAALQQACVQHQIALALGLPTFGADGRIFNSHLLLDTTGAHAAVVDKQGLTDPEATFFARGSTRPVAPLQGLRCSAFICREVEDADIVCAQLAPGAVDLLFWPGLMKPDPALPPSDPPRHVQQAQQLAARLGAHVVQANWANALTRPEESEHCGRSVVLSPQGALLFSLPQAAAGLAVFNLGAPDFEWHPEPA